MNLARRSSRATWRITSGRRYFSCVLISAVGYRRSAIGQTTIGRWPIADSLYPLVFLQQQSAVGGEEAFAVGLINAIRGGGQETADCHGYLLQPHLVGMVDRPA